MAKKEKWIKVSLAEILESLETGRRPKGGVQNIFEGVPSIGAEHLNDKGGFNFSKIKYVPIDFARSMKKGRIRFSDIIVVKDGATTGKTSFVDHNFPFENAVTNEHVFICRVKEPIEKKYVFYYLFSPEGKESILSDFRGAAQGGISINFPSLVRIPLAPLEQQKQISKKLDGIFGHLDLLNTRLDRIPELIKAFKEKVLSYAVTGKLTEEWRGSKKYLATNVALKDISVKITDGDHQAPPKSEFGIPFIVISDISNGKLDLAKVERNVPKYYYDSLQDYRKPQLNDILYTVTGSFGIPVFVNTDNAFCFQRHIGLVRPDVQKVDPKFLYYFLQTKDIFNQAKNVATGTAQLTVPLNGLRNFDLSIPNLEEQKVIVEKIETLFAKSEAILSSHKKLKTLIDHLPKTSLSKAFKGELLSK